MNILWVFAHPEPRSLNGSLRDAAVAQLHGDGYGVEQSDLYAMQWNPVVAAADFGLLPGPRLRVADASRRAFDSGALPPDIATEQQKLRRADVVVLQFPLWWFSMPAILKGWVDRVFVEGFGYGIRGDDGRTRRFGDGMLAGKRAMVVVSMGGTEHTVSARGINGSLDELLYPIQHGILWYTAMSVLTPMLVAGADRVSTAEYEDTEAELLRRLKTIDSEDSIPYRIQNGGEYDAQFVLIDDVVPHLSGMRAHLRTTQQERR